MESSKKHKTKFQNFFSHKKIEIIKIFNNNTQAKNSCKIACKLYKELPQESTVIVLGDENLLNLHFLYVLKNYHGMLQWAIH